MKFAWRSTIPDLAAWNSNEVDEINIGEYQGLLSADNWQDDFDKDLDNSSSLIDTIVIEQILDHLRRQLPRPPDTTCTRQFIFQVNEFTCRIDSHESH